MAIVTDYQKKDNKILAVTMTMQTDEEKKIFRSALVGEPLLKKCPSCSKKIEPGDVETMELEVHSPADPPKMGFYTGDPTITCPHCKAKIWVPMMMDITPFKSIVAYCKQLRGGVPNVKG